MFCGVLFEICNKEYKSKVILKSHLLVHDKSRPMFPCDICTQKCVTFHALKQHKRTKHSERQKFTCEVCDKVDILDLKKHMITHETNREKIKCDYCDKAFLVKSTYKRHLRPYSDTISK